MNILQYDLENYDVREVEEVVRYLNHHGFKVIAIPKDFILLLDVDSYTLHMLKQKIEDAIREKEVINDQN